MAKKSSTAKRRFKFEPHHLDALRARCRLEAADIKNLSVACRIAVAQGWFTSNAPTATDMRLRLKQVCATSEQLRTLLHKMPGALEPELWDRRRNLRKLRVELYLLDRSCRSIERSLLSYKSSGRVSTAPVRLIWKAIAGTGVELSSSVGSRFRSIVAICYEAMTGRRDADPERAIKAFIKECKAQA